MASCALIFPSHHKMYFKTRACVFSDCSSRVRSCPWLVLQSVVLESLKFIFTQIITPICIGMKHDWAHVRDAEGKYVPGERKDSQGNSCSRKGGLMVRVNHRFTVLCDFPFCAFKNMPKIWAGLSRILVWTTRVWKVEQCWLYRPLDNLLYRRFQSNLYALQEQGWTSLPGETCGWETKWAIYYF